MINGAKNIDLFDFDIHIFFQGCRLKILHRSFLTASKTVHLSILKITSNLGLDRTGNMSFLTGQDRTPKFAGRVLPDRTESGLLFISILPTNYRLLLLII